MAPGPTGQRWANFLRAMRDPLSFLQGMQSVHGDVVRLDDRLFLVSSPDGVQHVLQDNHPNYVKGDLYRRALRPLLGNGLVVAEGPEWKRQRRVAQPSFSKSRHTFFGDIITKRLDQCRSDLQAAAQEGRTIDLQHELVRVTVEIVYRLIFSEAMADRGEELVDALLACASEMSLVRVFSPVPLPDWLPTPSNMRLWKGLRVLDAFIYQTITARRQGPDSAGDLLSQYLSAIYEDTGAPLSDRAVRDEMMTLLMAGHETTGVSLTWLLYLLTRNTDVRERVTTEIDTVLGGRPPEITDLESLPFTGMAIREGLRLYPPTWGVMRRAVKDDVVGGYHVPAGSGVLISAFVVHRSASVWEDPLRFDPERFSPERFEGRHRFAWFPFGAGPRQCVGMGLALLELPLVLVTLLQSFDFDLVSGRRSIPLLTSRCSLTAQ